MKAYQANKAFFAEHVLPGILHRIDSQSLEELAEELGECEALAYRAKAIAAYREGGGWTPAALDALTDAAVSLLDEGDEHWEEKFQALKKAIEEDSK